ncbi:GNAT family N-acetyltransferase [Acetatifactor muris]|uniref:GNAT family N-acetyltransferase n=1 Tax=Acetatifactor muris TaxID=879566 RepID=UPI0023F32C6C|nr:GNAT family N-acetyltransferase [Acetatifactor muris]
MTLCYSDRLTVRRMKRSDLDELYKVISDPEVMRYIEPLYSYADAEKFLQEVGLAEPPLIYAVDKKQWSQNNLCTVSEDSHFIGYVIYHSCNQDGVEIGWLLKPEEWHKGYAGELTEMLLGVAACSARYAVIECSPQQKITRRIALKHGFIYSGMADGCEVFVRRFDGGILEWTGVKL